MSKKDGRMLSQIKYEFYTDGAASTKTNCGGWGCVVVKDGEIVDTLSGGEKATTNNRMELIAVLTALEQIDLYGENSRIFSDSAYVVNCIKDKWYEKWLLNGWRTSDRSPVKNRDLWEQLLNKLQDLEHQGITVEFEKVKGHADSKFNNYADVLAVKKRKKYEEGDDDK